MKLLMDAPSFSDTNLPRCHETQSTGATKFRFVAPGSEAGSTGQPSAPMRVMVREPYSGTRPRWSVLALILILHAGALALLINARYEMKSQPVERLRTFTLDLPPSPPPPEPAEALPETAPPPVAAISAPAPPISLRRTPSVSTAVPDLADLDLPPARLALKVPSALPPVLPRPAPPAPLTPPDFSAAQLANPGPSYPYLSRKAREEGVVTLRVLVSADGRAKQLSVEQSSGFARLDDEALKTVRRWRFLPARRAGRDGGGLGAGSGELRAELIFDTACAAITDEGVIRLDERRFARSSSLLLCAAGQGEIDFARTAKRHACLPERNPRTR